MTTRRRVGRTRLVVAALTALLVTLLVGPSFPANAEPSAHTWHVYTGEQTPNGAIQGMQFLPGDIWVDVGDTVHWTADSMEPHTVSFLARNQLPAPFNPGDPTMTTQTPQHRIAEPGQFRNSGILATIQFSELPPTITSYDLTFMEAGNYPYYCFFHGAAMKGSVHVAKAGTAYPHAQPFYDRQFRQGQAAVNADGLGLMNALSQTASSHHVFVGALDNMAMVMRFMRPQVVVRVGQTVDFDASQNQGDPVPHTVTFGPEPPAPIPVGDPTNFTGGSLSSGVIPTAGPAAHFVVTFNKAGVFPYICMFHDGMGMVGTVVVRPADH